MVISSGNAFKCRKITRKITTSDSVTAGKTTTTTTTTTTAAMTPGKAGLGIVLDTSRLYNEQMHDWDMGDEYTGGDVFACMNRKKI